MFSYNGSLYSVTVSRDTFSHLHSHMVPRTLCHISGTRRQKYYYLLIKNHYVIQIKTHTKQNYITQIYVVHGYSYVCAYLHGTRRARHRRNERKLPPNTLVRLELPQNDIREIHTNSTKSHHTNVRWCVCTPTCVRSYHGTRRARHRRNKRKLPPNTLVRRELPQNHITV